MKTITRTFLTAILLFSTLHVYAQEEIIEDEFLPKKVSFGIRAGLNFSNLTSYYEGNTYNAKIRVAYNIGALMDYHLTKDFYIRTGLSLSSKGAKGNEISIPETGEVLEAEMEAIYLQVPVYFTFKTNLARSSNMISVAGGPFFAYGIAGKSKYNYKSGGHYATINTFGENELWNRPDVGIGIELSFELQRLVLTYGAEMGFAKTWKTGYPYILEDVHVCNSTSFLSVGFNF